MPSQGGGYYAPMAAPPGDVSPPVLMELRGTKGWVQFVGVIWQIGGYGMVLLALFIFGLGSRIARAFEEMPGLGPMAGLAAGAFAVLLLILAGIFIYCGMKLFSYGSSIGKLLYQNSSSHLEAAARHHKSFWIVWTIVSIIGLVFSLLGVLAKPSVTNTNFDVGAPRPTPEFEQR